MSWKGRNRRNVKLWYEIHSQKRCSWVGCIVSDSPEICEYLDKRKDPRMSYSVIDQASVDRKWMEKTAKKIDGCMVKHLLTINLKIFPVWLWWLFRFSISWLLQKANFPRAKPIKWARSSRCNIRRLLSGWLWWGTWPACIWVYYNTIIRRGGIL